MAEKTVFQMIIDGDLPSTKVYEDDLVLAIVDIAPIQPGQVVLFPKKHSTDARKTDPETFAHLMNIGQKIATAQTTSLNCDGVNMTLNCGEAAGQEVFHTHLNLIPRFADDGVMPEILRGEYESNQEKGDVGAAIKNAL